MVRNLVKKLGIIGIVVLAVAAVNFGPSVKSADAACNPFGCIPGPGFLPGNCTTLPTSCGHPFVRQGYPFSGYPTYPVVNPYININPCSYNTYNTYNSYNNCVAPGYVPSYNNCSVGYLYSNSYCGPDKVNLAVNPSVLGCGTGLANVSASVTTWGGVIVPNGTPVNFATSIGSISSTSQTVGGTATASLQVPGNTSGTAIITVNAGGGSATTTIAIACTPAPVAVYSYASPVQTAYVAPSSGTVYNTAPAAPAAAQIYYPPAVQRGPSPRFNGRPGGAPGFLPPRTGDAGLLNIEQSGDDAANAALVQAFDHPYDSVYESAQATSTNDIVTPDDSAANSSLFGFSGSLVTQGSNFASA